MIPRSPPRMRSSVCVSTADREPSRIRMRGYRTTARGSRSEGGEGGGWGKFEIKVGEQGMRGAAIRLGGAVRTGTGKSGRISESEMTKFDFAARLGTCRDFGVAIIDIRFGGEDVIQPTHGSGATLENICDPSEGRHRPSEPGQEALRSDPCTQP